MAAESTPVSFSTALALVIPSDKIDQIREDHDRAYPRWMPHINFLFPFVKLDDFPKYQERLQKSLTGFGSFKIRFSEIGYFKQKRSATFHLKLEDDSQLQHLYQTILSTLPEITPKRKEFHPHLTLGQCKKGEVEDRIAEVSEILDLEEGIEVMVDRIFLISRSDSDPEVPFSIISEIQV